MIEPYVTTVTIRLTERERARLEEYADQYSMRVSTAGRHLLTQGLLTEERTQALADDNASRYARLMAATTPGGTKENTNVD